MLSLFRGFERFSVEYLLISGQASVLYGAATFSEDIDIWVRPSRPNLTRFLEALASCQARVYKLTPPLELRYLRAGHGFHFVVPSRPVPTYLDVLGQPPRVASYARCRLRSRLLETDWGRLPVVGIEDLVALKKTRRLSDYEIISNLVSVRLAQASSPSRNLLQWAARNTFRAEDRLEYFKRLGRPVSLRQCRRDVTGELARQQALDVAYWRSRIAELRRLRKAGRLLPEGTSVSRLPR